MKFSEAIKIVKQFPELCAIVNNFHNHVVECAKNVDPEENIFYALSDARCPIVKMEKREMTLEQVFIRITSQNIDTVSENEEE